MYSYVTQYTDIEPYIAQQTRTGSYTAQYTHNARNVDGPVRVALKSVVVDDAPMTA